MLAAELILDLNHYFWGGILPAAKWDCHRGTETCLPAGRHRKIQFGFSVSVPLWQI